MEEKIDKEDSLQSIKQLLLLLNNNVEKTMDKVDLLKRKIDNLNKKIDGELLDECKKMGSHIDFVEQVYDNVKHPLGYICKKVGYLTGNTDEQYTLTNLEKTPQVRKMIIRTVKEKCIKYNNFVIYIYNIYDQCQ